MDWGLLILESVANQFLGCHRMALHLMEQLDYNTEPYFDRVEQTDTFPGPDSAFPTTGVKLNCCPLTVSGTDFGNEGDYQENKRFPAH
jgi:hypothetical protein